MNSPFRNPPRPGDDFKQLGGMLDDLGRGTGRAVDTARHASAIADLRGGRRALFADSSVAVERFVIISVQGDYLTCKKAAADGTAGTGADVMVAKPKPLRSSTFATGAAIGGVTFPASTAHVSTRTSMPLASAGGGMSTGATYSEILTPDYVAGDNDIYASKATTGVSVDGVAVDWGDENWSARKYLPIKTEVKVCVLVNGVQTARKIMVSGGPIYT
jgi:hypothetical protein